MRRALLIVIFTATLILSVLFVGCNGTVSINFKFENTTNIDRNSVLSPKTQQAAPTKNYDYDWAEGTCDEQSDCRELEYGCGANRVICTSNPDKWQDASTCLVTPEHPKYSGYDCVCIIAAKRCAWEK